MGFAYGDFDAHDGLWQMCEKTQHNVTARMALVPRTLEARGLDASPLIHEKLLHLNDPHAQEAAGILEIILRDEITHVQVGNRWFLWLCEREKISPFETFERLCIQHQAPRMKPPFNVQARLAAGFTPEDIQALIEQER
jgi:uncharacterized ferritin-like protein (DUF455 family)